MENPASTEKTPTTGHEGKRDGAMMWNLDEMSEAELLETAEVLEQLARYARTMVQVLRFRAAGGEDRARNLQRQCDRLFMQLPVWAQWPP
jgi:hypothetical protein